MSWVVVVLLLLRLRATFCRVPEDAQGCMTVRPLSCPTCLALPSFCSYYNPIPHFGYDLALKHSPQVRRLLC